MLYTKTPPVGSDPVSRAAIMKEISEHSQIVSVASVADRNALASLLSPTMAEPVWVYRQDTQNIEVSTNGTTWKVYRPTPVTYEMADGWTTITFSNQPSASVAITYPAGRFTAPPRVIATLSNVDLGIVVSTTNETASGATVSATVPGGGSYNGSIGVQWLAVRSS